MVLFVIRGTAYSFNAVKHIYFRSRYQLVKRANLVLLWRKMSSVPVKSPNDDKQYRLCSGVRLMLFYSLITYTQRHTAAVIYAVI